MQPLISSGFLPVFLPLRFTCLLFSFMATKPLKNSQELKVIYFSLSFASFPFQHFFFRFSTTGSSLFYIARFIFESSTCFEFGPIRVRKVLYCCAGIKFNFAAAITVCRGLETRKIFKKISFATFFSAIIFRYLGAINEKHT